MQNNGAPKTYAPSLGSPPDNGAHSTDLLHSIFEAGSIRSHYQPLVSMRSQNVIGVEALARGFDPVSERQITPGELFGLVNRPQETITLDRLCRQAALNGYANRPPQCRELVLFLNFESSLLDMGVAGSGHLYQKVMQAGIVPNQVVIEIVESRVRDLDALGRFSELYRDHGFLLALDDVGAGHSNLQRIAEIKPDVIKIDRGLINGLETEFHKQEVARSIINLAQKIGAMVVAEGVESQEQALMALDLGVDILQGFYFARPQAGLDISSGCRQRVENVGRRFRSHTIDRVATRKRQQALYDTVVAQMQSELSGVSIKRIDPILQGLIGLHPSLECIYVLDRGGIQISESVCDPCKIRTARERLFQPASKGTDQSLKDYYMLLLAGLPRYVSEPYLSWASGNRCITISTWFQDATQRDYIICADFDRDLLSNLEA